MNKIRRKTKSGGFITQQEKQELLALGAKANDIIMRTKPIQPNIIIPAVEKLYAAANLAKPRVVVASSPLVMAYAWGAATWIEYLKTSGTYVSTWQHKNFKKNVAYERKIESDVMYGLEAKNSTIYKAIRDTVLAATDAVTIASLKTPEWRPLCATSDAIIEAVDFETARTIYSTISWSAHNATRQILDDSTAEFISRIATEKRSNQDESINRSVVSTISNIMEQTKGNMLRDTSTDIPIDIYTLCDRLAGTGGINCAKFWHGVYDVGNINYTYLSFVTACREVLKINLPEYSHYQHFEDTMQNAGGVLMHKNFCIVSNFPRHINFDNQGRLHSQNQSAIEWRDGFALYYWHGVDVPSDWILNPKALKPKAALQVSNMEQRRAACEIVGWINILSQLSARVINKNDNPEIGTLYQVDLPGSPRERFLQVKCGTGRVFAIAVPKEMETALQANAWTYGLTSSEYKLEART